MGDIASIWGLVDTMSMLVGVGSDATGVARRRARRSWSDEEQRRLVAQMYEAGTSVSVVARPYDLNANLLFTCRREGRQGERIATAPETLPPTFAPIDVVPDQKAPSSTRPEGEILIESPGGALVCVEGVVSEAALVGALRGLRAFFFYTIIQTCRLNGINPEAHLTDVIGRIADHLANRIDELLPWSSRPIEAYQRQAA